jgi:hypothetical protein
LAGGATEYPRSPDRNLDPRTNVLYIIGRNSEKKSRKNVKGAALAQLETYLVQVGHLKPDADGKTASWTTCRDHLCGVDEKNNLYLGRFALWLCDSAVKENGEPFSAGTCIEYFRAVVFETVLNFQRTTRPGENKQNHALKISY